MNLKNKKIIIGIVIILVLITFFFPKRIGHGSCGFCAPGQYKWIEKSCLGVKSSAYTMQNCEDCPPVMNCYGTPYGIEKCYNQNEEPRIEINCD